MSTVNFNTTGERISDTLTNSPSLFDALNDCDKVDTKIILQ